MHIRENSHKCNQCNFEPTLILVIIVLFGDFCKVVIQGILMILVNMLILANLVIMVNLVVLVNLAALVNIVILVKL